MAIGSGLGASVGIGAEGSYGTYQAPTRWIEPEKEALKFAPKRQDGKGLAAGVMVDRVSQRHTTGREAKGSMDAYVFSKGMGLWLAHTMGSTATPVQQGATAAYLQTHALGDNRGLSLTYQKGIPDTTGAVHPYTYLGTKITEAKFSCAKDGFLMFTPSLDSRDCTEAQSLVTPVYLTNNPEFAYEQCVFQIGNLGSEATKFCAGFEIDIKRPQKVDRYMLDGTGLKQEPIMNGRVEITGSIDTEYIDKTVFEDMFMADTSQSLIITFTGALIASTYYSSITFKLPCVRWNGDNVEIAGADVVSPKMTFKVFYDDTDVPFTIAYQSTDVAL